MLSFEILFGASVLQNTDYNTRLRAVLQHLIIWRWLFSIFHDLGVPN